jgi:hypothetical protein
VVATLWNDRQVKLSLHGWPAGCLHLLRDSLTELLLRSIDQQASGALGV